MAATGRRDVICRSRELVERGRGVRFRVSRRGAVVPAFVVRFDGRAHAYLNQCAHRMLELDWVAGEFFDAFGAHLLCATHGARYAPASGVCVAGPCARAGLVKLAVIEEDGDVCLEPGDEVHLVASDALT
jgi:nitrite reductase/ring-hydroxylating ferredoxin subunit